MPLQYACVAKLSWTASMGETSASGKAKKPHTLLSDFVKVEAFQKAYRTNADTVMSQVADVGVQAHQSTLGTRDDVEPGMEDPVKLRKHSIEHKGHMYSYMFRDRFVFLVIADHPARRDVNYGFLDAVSENFMSLYTSKGKHSVTTRQAFQPRLQFHMEWCDKNHTSISSVVRVTERAKAVRGMMEQNVSKILAHGEKIEEIKNKSHDLQDQSKDFAKKGHKLKSLMWWKKIKSQMLCCCVCCFAGVVLFFFICFFLMGNCITDAIETEQQITGQAEDAQNTAEGLFGGGGEEERRKLLMAVINTLVSTAEQSLPLLAGSR